MPVFNDLTITPQEKRDMIAYVTTAPSPTPAALAWAGSGR